MRDHAGLPGIAAPKVYVVSSRSRFLFLVLAAATAAPSAACGSKTGEGPKQRPPPMVVVAKVTTRDVPVEIRAPVDLRPLAQAEVGSKALGYLDAVLVDRGDKVRRGQLLALVRPSDLPDQLGAARGALSQAQASAALARQNYERAKSLAPSGVVSQQELQQSQTALANAEAAEAAAKAQVGGYATRLGETQITSPLDGVVMLRRLDPGALVGPTAPGGSILTVARVDALRIFVTMSEREVPLAKVGQGAHVELDALPGKSVKGTVVRLAPALDPATRTLDAEVQLENTGGELRPGMFGRAAIVVDVHPHAAVLPATAIQITNGKRYAYVLKGDKVERRLLETGVDGGTWLEIVNGVSEGEEIVTTGIDALSDKSPVRPTRGVDPFSAPAASASPPDAGLPEKR